MSDGVTPDTGSVVQRSFPANVVSDPPPGNRRLLNIDTVDLV